MTQRRPTDTGADYNAFGRDPYGWIAYLCALFFGPDYIPLVPRSQFGGAPEPPRYGPPARYQLSCLPAGFTPQYPNVNLVGIQESYAQGVDPIEMFDSRLCVWAQRFSRSERVTYWNTLGCTTAFDKGVEDFDDGATDVEDGWLRADTESDLE